MALLKPLPASLRIGDPVAFIATWFGAGLMSKAPGTWGSLAAIPPAWLIYYFGGAEALLVAGCAAFAIGIWAAGAYAKAAGNPDPSQVVIDEVAALWLILAMVAPTALGWVAAFICFRVFDVLKPWPVSLADRKIKGGFGIMLDDIVAAIYAMLVLLVLRQFVEGI
ncbi:MAG TPA: phosphatidylglycerophosphatase A [Parvibaculum sp.]